MWNPCDLKLEPGTKRQVMICPDVEGYRMPATLIAGSRPGKSLLITAGTHSCEFPSIPAAVRLAKEIEPKQICGNIMIIHCVNTSGFRQLTDAFVPEDGGNLNRDFPGDPDGSCPERIAAFFIRRIFPHVDFVADLHSGGLHEALTPCLFFPYKKQVREQALAAARALDIPYLVRSTNGHGIPGWAALSMGIPSLLLERGGLGLTDPECCTAYYRDMRLLMEHLGILPYDLSPVCKKHIYEEAVYLTAGEDGLWYPMITENQIVHKNDLLGYVEDFWGNRKAEYYAQADGTVLYYTVSLSISKSMPLVAYGVETSDASAK